MQWVKKGLIYKARGDYGWINSHAQIPTVLVKEKENLLRVYFSPRPVTGQSCIAMMDLDIDNPSRILKIYEKPVLQHGEPGDFDEHGCMPQWVHEENGVVWLIYAGWSRREGIPYSNWDGIAKSFDGGGIVQKVL